MRILVFNTLYEPDMGPSAPLFSSLSKELVRLGHQVTVVVPVPHFPSGMVTAPFRGKILWRSVEEGVSVIRVGLPSLDRTKLPLRLLQFLCYQLGTAWAIIGQRYDVVLSGSSSLSCWLPFAISVVLRRKPAVYSVQDLYPNVGITLGIFRHRWVITAVSALEKFCLNHATIVQIISEAFRSGLHDLGVPDSKIALLYNWIDVASLSPQPRVNDFSREHALDKRFVVLYAGNIGPSQGLEVILETAKELRNETAVIFVLIGDGLSKKALMAEAERSSLTNVLFLPFQPRPRLPEVMACANLSLVPLRKGIDKGSLPSKLLTVMASARPVLACVEKDSEMWKVVEKANAGVHVPPEDPTALANTIRELSGNPDLCERLGRSGRLWVENNHTPQAAGLKFERMLSEAIQRREKARRK